MGRQIVDPATSADRMAVVEALSKRLVRAVGDWRKHGEGADQLLAYALLLALGPLTLRTILTTNLTGDMPNERHREEPPAPAAR